MIPRYSDRATAPNKSSLLRGHAVHNPVDNIYLSVPIYSTVKVYFPKASIYTPKKSCTSLQLYRLPRYLLFVPTQTPRRYLSYLSLGYLHFIAPMSATPASQTLQIQVTREITISAAQGAPQQPHFEKSWVSVGTTAPARRSRRKAYRAASKYSL
jgi:hypothetical protein